jgi:hypothetical protein
VSRAHKVVDWWHPVPWWTDSEGNRRSLPELVPHDASGSGSSPQESICTKLVELLLIVWLREKNMINVYLRGRDCIESVRGV